MTIGKTLFPPSNREAALVAFLRTFWQVVRATGFLGGAGIITINATSLAHIDLQLLGYAVGAVLLSGVLSGALAAGDVLTHGLPDAYTATSTLSQLTIVHEPAAQPVTPAAPEQPAAGVPPAPAAPDPVNAFPPAPIIAFDAAPPLAVAAPVSPAPTQPSL